MYFFLLLKGVRGDSLKCFRSVHSCVQGLFSPGDLNTHTSWTVLPLLPTQNHERKTWLSRAAMISQVIDRSIEKN